MTFTVRYSVTDVLAPISRRRPGRPITPRVAFLVAHDTGNPGATAAAHARWYRNDPNPPKHVSSAHLFVDDVNIVQTVPALDRPEQALHVLYNRPTDNTLFGFDANRAAIGVEYCYGGGIDADEAYARFVWVLAYLCHRHQLDPSRTITGHHVLDPGRKTDPVVGLGRSGRSYEQLLRDVVDEFVNCGGGLTAVVAPAAAGRLITTVHLNERSGPARRHRSLAKLSPGTPVTCTGTVQGEAVFGNGTWCATDRGSYCWSGGLSA
jgi:hypothetical protein